jgi:hypothetical protein
MELVEAEGGDSLIMWGRVHSQHGSNLSGSVARTVAGGAAGPDAETPRIMMDN